jgi:D-alanyl-D-alanine dipeptidase
MQAVRPVVEDSLELDTCILPLGWVLIESDSVMLVDMPYATAHNFTNKIVYPCMKCLVREKIARKLDLLRPILKQENLKLVLRDCYRNRTAQEKLWKAKPDARFVKPPWRGSNHSRGIALDVELIDANNELMDMGTAYDDLSGKSYVNNADITMEQKNNRIKLQGIMKRAGFSGIRTEWWHFDGGSSKFTQSEELDLPCDCVVVNHDSQQ